MADVTVRNLVDGDRADWQRLWGAWQHQMAGAVPPEVTAKTWSLLLDESSGLHGLMARDQQGAALGFAHASLTTFAWTGGAILYLQDLYVNPEVRGQGAGTALLDGVYGLADKNSATQVFWMVDEADADLQRFYSRHALRTPYTRYMRSAWTW